jgi:succinate-semialdehyde dehydrogenase/glutarate-semialdehyde dehydrogenase
MYAQSALGAGRLAEVEGIVAEAVKGGAKVATGGRRPPGFNAGFVFEPTVLTEVADDTRVMAEENFAPICGHHQLRFP